MMWEALKVYKPLAKDELATAKKQIVKIISDNLKPFGFNLYGRKLIRLSNDLFHIIHLDARGSWMGASTSLITEIAIVSVYDTEVLIKNHELTFRKNIEKLIPGLKNYYQITQEYELFSEYISRKIIEYIIPYFDKFGSSKDILKEENSITLAENWHNPDNANNLIFYAELENHVNKNLISILDYKISFSQKLSLDGYLREFTKLREIVANDDWDSVDTYLRKKKEEVFKKLKIKEE